MPPRQEPQRSSIRIGIQVRWRSEVHLAGNLHWNTVAMRVRFWGGDFPVPGSLLSSQQPRESTTGTLGLNPCPHSTQTGDEDVTTPSHHSRVIVSSRFNKTRATLVHASCPIFLASPAP